MTSNYRRKKKGSKKRAASRGVRITVWLPPIILQLLDDAKVEEGCSRSWLITEAICDYLKINEEVISTERGYEIPKKFSDRVGHWTEAKKGGE